MSFNEILVAAGGFGLYQKYLTFGFLAFSLFIFSFSYWTQVFILMIPPHRCKISLNDTDWLTVFNASDEPLTDSCHLVVGNETQPCKNGYIYDFSLSFPTYTSEHNLVCENSYKVYLVHTVYWIGNIFGTLIFGIINDKYGRKRAYQSSVFLGMIADLTTYFSSNYFIFVASRFCSAAGGGSISTIAFVLAIEHCIPDKRRITIFVLCFVFAMSSLSLVWVGYFTFYWRHIMLISLFPTATAVVFSYFVPESPSWLVTKGRLDEAVKYIQLMARINGKKLSKDFIVFHLQSMNVNDTKHQKSSVDSFSKVVSYPKLRMRILSLCFLWLAACACYHGNNLALNFLPFNMYITYSIGAVIEIPGNLLVVAALDKIGRRWLIFGFFFAGGLFGIISANVQSRALVMSLVMLMRCAYGAAYDVTFSFSSELIPTVIRGRTISLIRTCGGLGGAIAPFIVSLAEKDPVVPLSCFGMLAIVAGLVMLTLPETSYQQLPQNLDDGENFGSSQSFWLCPFVSRSNEKSEAKSTETPPFSKARNVFSREKEIECLGIKELPKY